LGEVVAPSDEATVGCTGVLAGKRWTLVGCAFSGLKWISIGVSYFGDDREEIG